MKQRRQTILFILLILSLLIFSCQLWDPIIEGCTTSTACNYNPEAKEDDNSCIDPLGCDNWCPGDTSEVKELDCAGVCGGVLFIDCTGQCGILVIDECDVCGGNNTICKDCNGVVNGEAELDNCLECVGGNTGLEACTYDCTGYWGGDAEKDQCDVCEGDNSTCTDCNGVVNGTAYRDGCQDCVGGNTGETACPFNCLGAPDLLLFVFDVCGSCVEVLDYNGDGGINVLDTHAAIQGAADPTCIEGCDGIWENDGSQLVFDECNICDGDNTVCAGCDDIPNSGLEIDVCGVCGGDGTCLPENCIDGNESGYCQDLSVLQILIDNSSGTLSMDMDENGNGVIEPLELGQQKWGDDRLIFLKCLGINLSGEIPPDIGNLTSLTTLQLGVGQLSGSIPPEIGNLVNLTYLHLGNNQLTGEIPSEIGNLTSLTYLSLFSNELTGEIPVKIGNLLNLTHLGLSSNQLSGEIPNEICNLDVQWDHNLLFSISYNNLCPPYPSCIEDSVGEQDTSECEYYPICTSTQTATINVDGNPEDWSSLIPAVTDPEGNSVCGTGTDIKHIYTAIDADYAYVMVETYNKPIHPTATIEINFSFESGELHTNISNSEVNASLPPPVEYPINDEFVIRGNVIEIKIPLTELENTTYFNPTFVNTHDNNYSTGYSGCDPTSIDCP